jgi:hypothetical protein
MKKLKTIVKNNPEPSKGTNFVNPSQLGQYSATNQVSESASLNQYLKTKGIDPQYVSRDTKIAHSKSNAYLVWKKSHMNEDRTLTPGPTEKKKSKLDTAAAAQKLVKPFPGPGYHREEGKGSQTPQLTPEEVVSEVSMDNISPLMRAHVKKGRMSNINIGTRMASPKSKPKSKPQAKPRRLGFFKRLFAGEESQIDIKGLINYLDLTESTKKPKTTALDKFRKAAAERAKKHTDTEKNSGGMTSAIDRLQKHMNKEEISQAKVNKFHTKLDTLVHKSFGKRKDEDVSPLLHSIHKKSDAVKNKDLDKFVKGHKQSKLIPTSEDTNPNSPKLPAVSKEIKKSRKLDAKNPIWEGGDLMGDPKAAEISPADGANGGKEISEKKRQMSKSARMIKSIYKKKNMVKEDMYDHEKEDKSVVTYGKKPKHERADEKDSQGEKKPQAAAVLTGGTTLTGEKRDDIEIDPMMRNRPGQPDITKKDDKDKKKEDSKKDK